MYLQVQNPFPKQDFFRQHQLWVRSSMTIKKMFSGQIYLITRMNFWLLDYIF